MTARRTSARSLWLRWTWRDLRRRWVSVLVIAVIIAIGTGVYAGLGSTSAWRRMSNDASFAELNMHDVRVELSTGTFADAGRLAAVAGTIAARGSFDRAVERLVVATQVQAALPAGGADSEVLVQGKLVGMDVTDAATVDALDITAGRLAGGDTAGVVLESKFARHHGLAPAGTVTLAGAVSVGYTAFGVSPQEFLVTGPREGGFFGEANYAVVYAPLARAQIAAGHPGKVNDLVISLRPGADRRAVVAQLERAFAGTGQLPATVTTRDDDPSYRLLYDDIKGDQKVWTVLSLLVLGASAIAAFNLVSRIVESQRREIGIQMALGVPPRRLAWRPLLIGAQIALLGAVLGVVVGLIVGNAMRSLLVDVVPMPAWRTPFQLRLYLAAASLGFVLPFAASSWPVWRAVRVEPIDAIRTSHLTASDGLGRIGRHLHLPGGSLAQLPVRNLLRTPRRTLMTAVGVGASIAALVSVLGLMDSFRRTIGNGEREMTGAAPDRVVLQLTGFTPAGSGTVAAIAASPTVRTADGRVEVPSVISTDGHEAIGVLASFIDFGGAQWAPHVTKVADAGGRPGIVLSRIAARDLGVSPGDAVAVHHPRRSGLTGYTMADTTFTVTGLHGSPLRGLAYLPMDELSVYGLTGLVNVVDVRPSAGHTVGDVQRAMFGQQGVASAEPVGAISRLYDDALEQFVGVLLIAEVAVLALALLIAFNTTSVAVDERARNHATLFAFGLRVRRVVGMIVEESVAIGMASTAVGLALGTVLMRWMVTSLLAETVPEIGIVMYLSWRTVLTALALGVAAVGLTPVLLVRRLIRMDIPDTLRIME